MQRTCLFQWAVPLLCLRLTVRRRNRWIIITVYTWRLCLNFSMNTKPAADWPTHTSCASYRNVGKHKVIETAAGIMMGDRNIIISVLFWCEWFSFLVLQNDAQSTKWTKWMNAVHAGSKSEWCSLPMQLYMCYKWTHKKQSSKKRIYHLYQWWKFKTC